MSQKDINELCYYSFGQFYCLYISEDNIILYTSKSVPICYQKLDKDSVIFSTSPENLKYNSSKLKLNEDTIELDHHLFYRDIFSSIVSGIDSIPSGFKVNISNKKIVSKSYLTDNIDINIGIASNDNYLKPFLEVLKSSDFLPYLALSWGNRFFLYRFKSQNEKY